MPHKQLDIVSNSIHLEHKVGFVSPVEDKYTPKPNCTTVRNPDVRRRILGSFDLVVMVISKTESIKNSIDQSLYL